jgi:hypothetical protein
MKEITAYKCACGEIYEDKEVIGVCCQCGKEICIECSSMDEDLCWGCYDEDEDEIQ